MRNYANDKGKRERLRARLEKEKDERSWGKKVLQRKRGREEDERAAKANGGRHIERAERRTINVRTTTSRWLAKRLDRSTRSWTKSSFRDTIRDYQKFRLSKQRYRHYYMYLINKKLVQLKKRCHFH